MKKHFGDIFVKATKGRLNGGRMAKYCGKCGNKLDEKTGTCSRCEKKAESNNLTFDNDHAVNEKRAKTINRNSKKEKNGKLIKKNNIKILAVVLAVVIISIVSLVLYKGKISMPNVKDFLVSIGIKNEMPPSDIIGNKTNNSKDISFENNSIITSDTDDLGENYEVPKFDAKEYFENNTILKSTIDVISSENVSTELESFFKFDERGFGNCQVTYDYDLDGTYLGTNVISKYSSLKHPMYQTYYFTSSEDVWMVVEINGSFFATPITYNFSNERKVNVIISETDTITSYDSSTNKFYINIPNDSYTIIKTISKIDAAALEDLKLEEIEKS